MHSRATVILVLYLLIVVVSARPLKNVDMIKQLTNETAVRMKFVKAYLAHLIRINRIDDVVDIFEKLEMKQLQDRYNQCVETMKSQAICNHSVPYYIWAQLMASNIMNGENY